MPGMQQLLSVYRYHKDVAGIQASVKVNAALLSPETAQAAQWNGWNALVSYRTRWVSTQRIRCHNSWHTAADQPSTIAWHPQSQAYGRSAPHSTMLCRTQ